MRPPAIVVSDPFRQQATQMPFVERNDPIEAFTTRRADHSFAVGVCLRRRHRRLEHLQSHRVERAVHSRPVDAVPVVHHEAVSGLTRHTRTKPLYRPFGSRMRGHVPVHDPTCTHVEHDEDVEQSEPCRHRDEEITREHVAGMVAHERVPRLGPQHWIGRWRPAHVASDRSRRDRDAEFEQQFCGDALLAPRSVRVRHLRDQLLQVRGIRGRPGAEISNARTAERVAVPAHQRVGLHNRQHWPPVDESGQDDERQPRGVGGAAGLRWRSMYRASRLRRKRFSAASRRCECKTALTN